MPTPYKIKKTKPLKLADIKPMVDKDYESGYDTRLKASNDRVFFHITQNDDWVIEGASFDYLGQFDLLHKAGRQIQSDGEENPVQLDFIPVDTEKKDGGELVDGMYRTDDNNNLSIESYANARSDQIVCGVGAWELYTDYSSHRNFEDKQVIRRRPLYEAVNTVFWDANAKHKDKSDASRVVALVAYSEDGYREFVSGMTGDDPEDVKVTTFKDPEQSFAFPWFGTGSSELYYIGNFYYRKKIKTKLLTMEDPLGETKQFMENQIFDVIDELMDEGWSEISSKEIVTWEVRKYIVSGSEILNGDKGEDGERQGEVIAGIHIPIVPVYGEHTFVEGEEHYEGFVRLAKDPARLRNFVFNFLASLLVAPVSKPIYYKEQIAGFEKMYAETGADDNYPYKLMNLRDVNGKELPLGPIGVTPGQEIPQALAALIPLTRESVEDVAPSMMPKEISDPSVQIASKTVAMMQSSISEQSTIYQVNFATAKRRDGEIYASMAAEIYDTRQKVVLTLPDGTRKDAEVMQSIVDEETGKEVILNDINNAEFEVISNIGPAYRSQKEQTLERMTVLMQGMQPGDPKRTILELEIMSLMDGVATEDLRDYGRRELITMGVKKPDTDEEKQMVEDAKAQPQKPDAGTLLAEAEMEKAKVGHEKNQIEMMKINSNTQNENVKRMIEKFEAMTERFGVQIDAQEAGANIEHQRADIMSKQVDMAIADMGDDDLMQIAMGG